VRDQIVIHDEQRAARTACTPQPLRLASPQLRIGALAAVLDRTRPAPQGLLHALGQPGVVERVRRQRIQAMQARRIHRWREPMS
jgi:hypothetical protein